jgi:hypothetical protein
VRAHAQVNETQFAQARIVPGPQVVIGRVAEKIKTAFWSANPASALRWQLSIV